MLIGPDVNGAEGTRGGWSRRHSPSLGIRFRGDAVSKKTKKRKLNARRKKANHGRRPNAGRR